MTIEKDQKIRPLEKQFEKPTVEKIRRLQNLIAGFPLQDGGGRFYLRELVNCLEAGLLLASTQLSLSFLEIFVRDLLVYQKAKHSVAVNKKQEIERFEIEIEDSSKPQWGFSKIAKELKSEQIISGQQYESLVKHYESLRNPIHHGITRRFIRGKKMDIRTNPPHAIDLFFESRGSRSISLEDRIEEIAIDVINEIFTLLLAICHDNKIRN